MGAGNRNVGRLLDALEEMNLHDKTVMIFAGDRGCNIGHRGDSEMQEMEVNQPCVTRE